MAFGTPKYTLTFCPQHSYYMQHQTQVPLYATAGVVATTFIIIVIMTGLFVYDYRVQMESIHQNVC